MQLDSHFTYKNEILHCEGIPLPSLAKKYGTPLFVTSKSAILDSFQRFEKAFAPLNHLTCYSVKANYTLEVIRALVEIGSGFDVNSGGELFRTLKAGANPEKIIMAGVGKTADEIEYALQSRILMLKAESLSEVRRINTIAKKLKRIAPVALRITPNITAETHPYITTGNHEQKFGIDEALAEEVLCEIKSLKHLRILGLDMHIGSQIQDPKYYYDAALKLIHIKSLCETMGIEVEHLDIGGGFPVTYSQEKKATPIEEFAKVLVPLLKSTGAKILLEPGRYMVANASVLLSEVLYIKENHNKKKFIIVDAAMNDLIRPALYGAHHEIIPVVKRGAKKLTADIVGPVCETGDFFARERTIAAVEEGDLVAILSAGAYSTVMASNYNARPRAAEVMVCKGTAKVIRRRETYEQMVANEE
ncbi:MAG: diaminopimelate decarboxylase [Chloroherpetonaceae bacterium]|nr:diaminopimelate decarboxylase [Chloroherpetonaceae bacterium]MDW8020828.1 diaminopimelate decarboxylase [Chloroherpetonaceae bacterium]